MSTQKVAKKQPARAVECWIPIATGLGVPWVTRIWTEYHKAERAGKLRPIPSDASELAIHLSTRLDMLPRVFQRVTDGATRIYQETEKASDRNKARSGKKGYAFELSTPLKHEFLLDIDSLLFEVHSCCELMTAFLQCIYDLVHKPLSKRASGTKVREVVQASGHSAEWFTVLASHRHLFIHEAAPYIAMDVTAGRDPDILIMKENIREFSDEGKFVRLSQLAEVVDGFEHGISAVQQHLVDLLAALIAPGPKARWTRKS